MFFETGLLAAQIGRNLVGGGPQSLDDGGSMFLIPYTRLGQGHAPSQARTGSRKLLDRPTAARTCAGIDERSVLKELFMEFIAELWRFMRVRKKFWLLPILVMMVVFGGLVVLTKGSAIAPFIYTIF